MENMWKKKRKRKKTTSIITLICLWLRFMFLLFFDCPPPICFLCEDTRLELGDWGIWNIPLAGWGEMKKKSWRSERGNVSGLLLRDGWWDRGRDSWSLPEVKAVLKWRRLQFQLFVLTPQPRVLHSTLRLWQDKVFTLHKVKPSPWNQLDIWVCVNLDKPLTGSAGSTSPQSLPYISLRWAEISRCQLSRGDFRPQQHESHLWDSRSDKKVMELYCFIIQN